MSGEREQATGTFLVGSFELTIDAKNRLAIPLVIRDRMVAKADGRSFYLVPGQRLGTLDLYPDLYFRRIRANAPPAQDLSDVALDWQRFEYPQTAFADPDTQGRVTIPERLLKRAQLTREVTLVGVRDHLEVWSRADYDAFADRKWPDYPSTRARAWPELKERGAQLRPAQTVP